MMIIIILRIKSKSVEVKDCLNESDERCEMSTKIGSKPLKSWYHMEDCAKIYNIKMNFKAVGYGRVYWFDLDQDRML